LLLKSLGANVAGYALEPSEGVSLFDELNIRDEITHIIGDIRDAELVKKEFKRFQPEIVIHMAAQPLVRQSYADPVETYTTNINGTINILEAIRSTPSISVILNITTDKVYENKEWVWGYRENETLGGRDPYSNSKACADLIASAYNASFFQGKGVQLASVRAGNVIGGGDWSKDRLVPDVLRSLEKKETVIIRNPEALRPWQHVLEPLFGYLLLAEKLFSQSPNYVGAWNFGPNELDYANVSTICDKMCSLWGSDSSWALDSEHHVHEAQLLKLDSSKARSQLNWLPKWDINQTLTQVVSWHRAWLAGEDMRQISLSHIQEYNDADKAFLISSTENTRQ